MDKRAWNDLSDRKRRVIVAFGVVEGLLKIAALRDLRRRPAEEVRGPKKAWALGIVLVNAMGAAPAAYYLFGRRRRSIA